MYFKRLGLCVRRGMRVGVCCRGGSWGGGAEVTSSGYLSRGSRGRDCRVLVVIWLSVEKHVKI